MTVQSAPSLVSNIGGKDSMVLILNEEHPDPIRAPTVQSPARSYNPELLAFDAASPIVLFKPTKRLHSKSHGVSGDDLSSSSSTLSNSSSSILEFDSSPRVLLFKPAKKSIDGLAQQSTFDIFNKRKELADLPAHRPSKRLAKSQHTQMQYVLNEDINILPSPRPRIPPGGYTTISFC